MRNFLFMNRKGTNTMISVDIIDALTRNAAIFLNCAIQAINRGLHKYSNKVIAIVNLQMALELAMKAKIVDNYGVAYIVSNLDHNASDEDIKAKYKSNSLKIKEFESLKNFLKSEQMFDFEKPEYRYMERFQTYRNKLVHFNYNFSEDENEQIEKDIFYVLVFLLGAIMSDALKDDKPTYMQEYIDMAQYEKLMQNGSYITALNAFIVDTYGKTYYCPTCSRRFLTPSKKCLGCLLDVSSESGAFGYIDCKFCGMESSVIYDRLNIDLNRGMLRGLCLNCESDTIVYKCPKCGRVYDLEGFGEICTPDQCIYLD